MNAQEKTRTKCGFLSFVVETTGVEPVSEEIFTNSTTSVVCGQHSLTQESTNKLSGLVASLIHDFIKAFEIHVHRIVDARIPDCGNQERTAALRQRMLNYC